MKYLLEGEETERLNFRLLKESDFDTWIDFFNDSRAPKYLGMQEIGSPLEQCKDWFNRVMERYEKNLGGLNVLIDKNTHEFIGQCGLLVQEVDGISELEIGYSILPGYWNMGYATEAAIKCRDYAFEHNFAESIISIIHIENTKSERVAIKNGMVKTKQTTFMNLPVNIFRIDKMDWERMDKV